MVILRPRNLLNIRLLRIYSLKNSQRLQYAAEIIFRTILGIDYEIIVVSEDSKMNLIETHGDPILLYGFKKDSYISIPDDGLLFENDILKKNANLSSGPIPKIYFNGHAFPEYSVDFDILSALFYMVTQYEYYHSNMYDEHGRHVKSKDSSDRDEWQSLPIAEIYANHVLQMLRSVYPTINQTVKEFEYKITFDIDNPFLYKHKSLAITLGSLIKKLLSLKWNSVAKHVWVLLGGEDPYDVFDYIIKRVPKDKILFFFLINRKTRHDSRHTHKTKEYADLIKKISESGIETGIHPSYSSYRDKEMIQEEISLLEKMSKVKVTNSRMHFLKYRLPDTFEYLNEAGISDDYTICPIHHTGYKSYMARPYKWFDLSKNMISRLTLHPTMVMDRGLQKYMQLNPDDAWLEIKSLIDLTRSYKGVFTILFHNDSLSETGEWKGWKMVFENTILYLSGKNQ